MSNDHTDPTEWAEDVCRVCGTHLGQGIRAMHVGICETCPDPDVCPHCEKRNTNALDGTTYECYDCGQTYDTATKADRA